MKNFKKVIETFEKNKERELITCENCAANVFMKEIGTDCVDFLLDSNNISVKFLKEIFGIEVKQGCIDAFIKNMLPLIPEKIKKKFSFNYCVECRLASIIIYESATRNKI